MPRLARVICGGVPHHVTQRGNRRGQVFFTSEDHQAYLQWLQEYTEKHEVDVLAYCLMPNHVHLVVVPKTNQALHRVLKPLHMRYAQRVNRARNWKGHVWQGRYFSSALDETYLWAAIRYVELNPVRAGMIHRAEDFAWSSARAHCGLSSDPVLSAKPLWLRQFEGIGNWSAWLAEGDERQSLEMLRKYADKGLPCGSPSFIETLEKNTGRLLRYQPQGRPRISSAKKG
ncbi:MAG: transposase [Steroidobacteraceae bacterium]|nr:transposase [Steroidobacteraceae bacterium]